MPICRRRGPVSILGNSILEICGGQSGTRTSFYSEYFGFLASMSRFILIFIYMSLLPGRQTNGWSLGTFQTALLLQTSGTKG